MPHEIANVFCSTGALFVGCAGGWFIGAKFGRVQTLVTFASKETTERTHWVLTELKKL